MVTASQPVTHVLLDLGAPVVFVVAGMLIYHEISGSCVPKLC